MKQLSFQWRITLLTALLLALSCVTLNVLVYHSGAYYFDTFPDASGMDPVAECEVNIKTVRRLVELADELNADPELKAALENQDSPRSQALVNRVLLGVR